MVLPIEAVEPYDLFPCPPRPLRRQYNHLALPACLPSHLGSRHAAFAPPAAPRLLAAFAAPRARRAAGNVREPGAAVAQGVLLRVPRRGAEAARRARPAPRTPHRPGRRARR